MFAYTSFISGLANHGQSARAIETFKEMESDGLGQIRLHLFVFWMHVAGWG